MLTEERARRHAIIKEIYVGVIGWAWIATSLASVYFFAAALFFGSSWWRFLVCAAGTWLLYQVSL
jgi:hypothetical protein